MPLERDPAFTRFGRANLDLVFTMLNENETVPCRVSIFYLIGRTDLLKTFSATTLFKKFRSEVEQIASDKFDAGSHYPRVAAGDLVKVLQEK
jgi:hypothetical protein